MQKTVEILIGPPCTPVAQTRLVIDAARVPVLLAFAELPDRAFENQLLVLGRISMAPDFMNGACRYALRRLEQKIKDYAAEKLAEHGIHETIAAKGVSVHKV